MEASSRWSVAESSFQVAEVKLKSDTLSPKGSIGLCCNWSNVGVD